MASYQQVGLNDDCDPERIDNWVPVKKNPAHEMKCRIVMKIKE
jgi:hypothetical protein